MARTAIKERRMELCAASGLARPVEAVADRVPVADLEEGKLEEPAEAEASGEGAGD